MVARIKFLARVSATVSILSLLSQPSAVVAQDKEKTVLQQITELTTALETLKKNATADSVANNGGALEAELLSSAAINSAGRKIARDLQLDRNIDLNVGGKVDYILAGTNDPISTDAWLAFDVAVKGLCFRLVDNFECVTNTRPPAPSPSPGPEPAVGGAVLPALVALAPLFSSLLSSSTTISDLPGGLTGDNLLAFAILNASACKTGEQLHCNSVFYAASPRLSDIPLSNPVIERLSDLIERRNEKGNLAKPTEKEKAAVKAVDEYLVPLMSGNAQGKVPLIDVIRAKKIADLIVADAKVVRIKIEKSHGSLLSRKGLDVAFGAPSLRVSGGLIATYFVDDGSGKITQAGMVVCRTRVTELKKVHRLKISDPDAASCE